MLKLVAEPKAVGEVFNIGNGAEISIRDLAYKVKAMTGSNSPVEFVPYAEVFDDSFEDMPRRVPDISKIRRYVGYSPTVHLDEIIDNVVEYWRTDRAAHVVSTRRNNLTSAVSRAASAPPAFKPAWSIFANP
jgi:UDP-glucose 4-epimerase